MEGKPKWLDHVIVYAEVERTNLFEWERIWTTSGASEHFVGIQLPYEYRVFQNGHTAFSGQINANDITAIEVNFSNDEKVRKNVQNGFFLIFSAAGADICELLFFSAENQIVDEKSLNRNRSESNECPRNP